MSAAYSGDIFLAFSTASPQHVTSESRQASSIATPPNRDEKNPMHKPITVETVRTVIDTTIDTLFAATADVTEEAVLNALSAAETMTGVDGYVSRAMPKKRVKEILREHGVI